ncbi:MAG TPA: SBBP repeat-containing protein, partial [Chitinophagaceae bacterium]|nr:SBBP repeat-containing protein [Chitinophagaceae bacterium]
MKFFKLFFFLLISTSLFVAGNAFSQTEFIENKGQWDKQVKFMTAAGSGAFFLQKNGFTVLQHNPGDVDGIMHNHRPKESVSSTLQMRLRSHAYAVKFVGANENPEIIPDKLLPSVNNYFIGNDKSKWAGDCKIYGGVTYKNVYPNIDVRYYSDAGSRLKYDIIVHPGGDIKKIALQYIGADGLAIKNKELVIKTSVGENKELYPYTYQVIDNQRKEVDTKYEVKGDVVKFKIKDYSGKSTLVIDPSLVFFTYSGSKVDNWGFTATYGPDGSFFSGGIAFGSGFPVSTGAFQTGFGGGARDIAIMKLTPDGKNRVYATYIGGDNVEQPHSLVVDPQGNLILSGRTNSGNYPTTIPVFGSGGGYDMVITKLNASGNALIGSMKIGGAGDEGVNIETAENGTNSLKRSYGDDARSEVIIDGANNIYVAGCTQSAGTTGSNGTIIGAFPTTPGALQTSFGGGTQDGVVLKLNPNCNGVIWSSCLGGDKNDALYVLALGNNNNLYVAGGTASNNIPSVSSSGVISSANAGGACDGLIVELTNNGTTAIRGTYLGIANSADQIYGIQTDITGNIYVMGTTEGSWPVLNANIFGAPNSKQFVSKLQPDLSAYIYSTTFGSGQAVPNISPTAFLVDRCENVYVSGWGGKANTNLNFKSGTSTKGMPVTADAIKPVTDVSGSDFYFIVIEKNAAKQLYGTFFGEDNPVSNSNPENF